MALLTTLRQNHPIFANVTFAQRVHSEILYNIRPKFRIYDRLSGLSASGRERGLKERRRLSKKLHRAILDNDVHRALDLINDAGMPTTTDWTEFFYDKFDVSIFSCDDCGLMYLESSSNDVNHGDRIVCDGCTDSYYWSDSERCYMDTPDYDEDDEDDEDESNGSIGDYHSSRKWLGHIPSSYDARLPRVLLGLELEIESERGSSASEKAESILSDMGTYYETPERPHPYCLMERDGSLDYGFEMVTAYTGLDVHAEQLKSFKKKYSGLRSHDTKTCGLHVHICKSGMTTLHASKMILFINDESNLPLIKSVARRDSSSYAVIKNKTLDKTWMKDAVRCSKEKASQLRNLNSSRYEALNFQNERTVEFRLFRGSLKYETIMSCLEFTFATWHFCRDASVSDLTSERFIEFICKPENLSDTKHLRPYLKSRGINIPEAFSAPSKTVSEIAQSINQSKSRVSRYDAYGVNLDNSFNTQSI